MPGDKAAVTKNNTEAFITDHMAWSPSNTNSQVELTGFILQDRTWERGWSFG